MPAVSIVIPVYRNAGTLRELHARLVNSLGRTAGSFEMIFVDDASPDASPTTLRALASDDSRVVVVSLLENVGQQRAVLAGLSRARGDRTVIMDADLQDRPEAVPLLLGLLDGRVSAVFASRRGAHQPLTRRLTSRLFKMTMRWLCGTPADAGVFVAIDRPMKERLIGYERPGPSIFAMIGCAGLPMTSVPLQRDRRPDGRSTYTWDERVALSIRALVWVLRHKWRAAAFRD